MNVATDPRNRLRIVILRHLSAILRYLRHQEARVVHRYRKIRRIAVPDALRTFTVVPPVRAAVDMADLLNRLAWYLPNRAVDVFVRGMPIWTEAARIAPPAQASFLDRLRCRVLPGKPERSATTTLLVWRWPAILPRLHELWKAEIVDPAYYSTEECVTWARLYWLSLDGIERQSHQARFRDNFERLVAELAGRQRAYVIATGPSSDRAHEIAYDDNSVRILCNSAVRNDALLAAARPQILTFADPVFHFGPSVYAEEFRRCMLRAVEAYDCYCVVPEEQAVLLAAHYPALADRLIGIALRDGGEWLDPTPESPVVRGTGNVLTQFMLPMASVLAREILVVGADGRQPTEKYFWKHSEKNQFAGLMQTVVDTHPSFFRDRVYEDYYEEHCRALGDLIGRIESGGARVFSLAPSYIPALVTRFLPNACWGSVNG